MKKRYVQAMMAGTAVLLSFTLPLTTVNAAVPEKEQTVYVNADENGEVENVIVSNWLKNMEKDNSLTDKSNLQNIENVKGEERFTKGKDGTLTWDAAGKDIYYQGETKEQLPVSVKMTYFLNGKEIKPEALAGKSGKIKIRIDYENKTMEDGICTPFMMVTGMMLPAEKFTNVAVENGKVISDGKNDIVVGMGFPGLAESLKLSEIEGLGDKNIPDYVEITADVEDFSLGLTATVATTGTLKEFGLDKIDSLDELDEKLNTLTSSSEALVEGSKALRDGVAELDSSATEFKEGLQTADRGAGALKDGIQTMNDKKGELLSGIDKFIDGMDTLHDGAKGLESGINSYTGGAEQVAAGVKQSYEGSKGLRAGAKDLQTNLETYTGGVGELSAGLTALYGELETSIGTLGKLPAMIGPLAENIENMASGAATFQQGAEQVESASQNLAGMLGTLKGGVNGAKGYVDQAIDAVSSVQNAGADSISGEATKQAKNIMKKKLQEADAKQKENVRAALNSVEGLTDEQKNAILENLGGISTDVQDVNIRITPDMIQTNEQASAKLSGAKSGLQGIEDKLNGVTIDAEEIELLKQGAQTAVDGAGKMQEELGKVSQSMAGMGDISKLTDKLLESVKALKDGGETLCGYNKDLNDGVGKLAGGAKDLNEGLKLVNDGAGALVQNNKELNAGAKQLTEGSGELLAGSEKLRSGAGELSNGIGQLNAGASELKSGTGKLAAGGKTLKDGTSQLSEGAGELFDGMAKFDEEGIQKLSSKLNGGFKNVLDRLKKLVDADEAYTAFDGKDEKIDGNVKFIIETAGIEE